MTYSTCLIEEIDDFGASLGLTDLGGAPGSGPYWLPFVRAWAETACVPLTWVDGAWLRLILNSEQANSFLATVASLGSEGAESLLPGLRPESSYIVEAEEF